MDADTLFWDDDSDSIVLLDQTRLPGEVTHIRCTSIERLVEAIRHLEVRGAPALGAAGGYGVALAAFTSPAKDIDSLRKDVRAGAALLRQSRPTAINLSWGVDRVLRAMIGAASCPQARALALDEARAIAREDIELCHAIGRHGASLLPDKCTVLTHCNAGALACVQWGTALGVIRSAVELGKSVSVIACETRPLNQGSRLTAWELARDNIDVRVITDSTAAFLMRKGEIDAVVVGADRITNDAVFNKIGTYMHAVCARHHAIPFYVAAPYSTFDLASSEDQVVVEERSRDELAVCGGRQLMPDSVDALNYAFDATPLDLVTGIITEEGVLTPPYFKGSSLPQ
jgi:methylthioribose-1-phosphate isomerase